LPSWKINQFSIRPTIYCKICNKKFTKYSPKTGLCLELATGGFISQWVMPENQIPATHPEPGAEPGELNFAKPASETQRIKRRSLKTKQRGLIKPSGSTPPAARELEREAPPLSPEEARTAQTRIQETAPIKTASTMAAPPRTTPSVAATTTAQPASAGTAFKAAPAPAAIPAASSTSTSTTAPSIRSTATPTTSPHGTRPATLYYSSQPRKAETPSPMKTMPTASPASSASTTTAPLAAARSATSASRPASPIDYRTNVERQSREQKSVGSLLSYVVYGLIAIFVMGALLAAYGANVIFERIHSQSVTVSELDTHYASANTEVNAKLATAQDTLSQAQAQIARQQDLILKQQDAINKLINATNDDAAALKSERQARAQEASNLRMRVRQLEIKNAQQKL
jgi:hypothetical protein